MPNSYYNHGTVPATNAPGASAPMRAEFDAVTAGFALLPTLAANANKIVAVNAGATALAVISQIDGFPIGQVTPAAGSFTTLSATGATALAALTSTGINSSPVGATTPSTGAFTTLSASGATTLAGMTSTGINSSPIGATTPSTGKFTTLLATSMDTTPIGQTTPAAGKFTTLVATGATTLAGMTSTGINSSPVGATTPSTGAFTTLSASGATTLAAVTATSFSGDGSALTGLNASNIASGTVPTGRVVGSYTSLTGVGALAAGSIAAGFSGAVFGGDVSITKSSPLLSLIDGANSVRLGISGAVGFVGTNSAVDMFFQRAGSNYIQFTGTAVALLVNTTLAGSMTHTGSYVLTGGTMSISGAAYTPTSSQAFTATPTFNAALSNIFEFSGVMTGNVTSCTINNPTAGQTITIRVKQDGTGGRTFASPAGAVIAGSVNTTIGKASLLTLTYSAMDTRWEGTWTQLP